MIQYNELQQGNLVFFEKEKAVIQSIHSMNGRTDVDFNKYNIFQNLEECCTTIEKFAFISLNKNIMEQLDFKSMIDNKKETTYYQHKTDEALDKSFFITEFEGLFKMYSYRFKSKFVRISNVHELQNIFYMIKNKKLPIKKIFDFDDVVVLTLR